MSTEDGELLQSGGNSASHVVQNIVQFARIARYRKNVLLGTLLVMCLLGGLYAATATRYYQGDASLLILQTGGDELLPTINMGTPMSDVMPTYQALMKSAVVLEGALTKLHPKNRLDFRDVPQDKWLDALGENLRVSVIRRTKLITVKYQSKDPAVATEVVRALIQSYIEFIDKTHKGTAGEIINVLTREKIEMENKLIATRQELIQARQAAGDFGVRADGTVMHPIIQTAIYLNEALVDAQRERLDRQAALATLQISMRNGEDLQQHLLAIEGFVGREILMSGLGFNTRDARVQSDLERGLLKDRAELNTLSEHFGDAHPRVTEVKDRIRSTEQYLQSYQGRINERISNMQANQLGPMLVQMMNTALNKAWQQETALRSAFEEARQAAIHHEGNRARAEILEHDVARLERLNDLLIEKIANTDIRQEQGDVRAEIVKPPAASNRPVWPKLPIIGVICVVATLIIGGVIIYVQDIMDDRFRTPEELGVRLGVQVLALVRELAESEESGLRGVQCFTANLSGDTESFRTLRTALSFRSEETGRLVVSSSEPGDGKTTVMANLAVTFAHSGKRTLLIDADMRRPGMTNLLQLKGDPGLSDVLHAHDDVAGLAESYVQQTELEGLDVLPAGPRRPNPAELLSGSRMGDLLAWADGIYDQVLVDSPPVLAASDTLLVGRLVDGVIIVVRPEKNRRRLVQRAVESFSSKEIKVFGVVANGVTGESGKGYGFDYEYGYGYGYGYGESNEDTEEFMAAADDDDADDIDFGPTYEAKTESDPIMIVPRKAA